MSTTTHENTTRVPATPVPSHVPQLKDLPPVKARDLIVDAVRKSNCGNDDLPTAAARVSFHIEVAMITFMEMVDYRQAENHPYGSALRILADLAADFAEFDARRDYHA